MLPRLSRPEILALQESRLRELVAHAYENVPFYRQLFDSAGVHPHDIRGIKDLCRLPIISKNDLRAVSPESIVARGLAPNSLHLHSTSGSSGEPFQIRRSGTDLERFLHFLWRHLEYYGAKPDDSVGIVVRLPDALTETKLTERPRLRSRVRQLWRAAIVLRHSPQAEGIKANWINCLLEPEAIYRQLLHSTARVLVGYPSVLARVALQMNGQAQLRPRLIATMGENLTPGLRLQLAEAFDAPVFDIYASNELGYMAWECRESGQFHVCDDGVILEVLRDNQPVAEGEWGEVVGTNLNVLAQPFIRYRMGDIVTKGRAVCACGQPFSTILEVQGRKLDYFRLPDGRDLHPYCIEIALREFLSDVGRFQLIQERENLIIARVTARAPFSPQQITRMQEAVTSLIGNEVEFRVDSVEAIAPEPNGKFRVYRSLLN
ncbi:phenylacetate-coenzyme A ligase [Abditibacteriota bacterium]|nr:phenylacetate-coenzyme A ligase [Abditibacteriota bacterium]